MKAAIYIEDGLTQLVLTPESDFEKGVVSEIKKGDQNVNIYAGSFYECQGGWIRNNMSVDESLIIRISMEKSKEG